MRLTAGQLHLLKLPENRQLLYRAAGPTRLSEARYRVPPAGVAPSGQRQQLARYYLYIRRVSRAAASHLGEARLVGSAGPLRPASKEYRGASKKSWEIVSRHDIGRRLAVARDGFGVAPQKPQHRRI